MAKFYGQIGYATTVETSPGIWEEKIIERNYCGDMMANSRSLQSANKINDDVNISNTFSIIADPYARDNFHKMRYITFMGSKWKITNVNDEFPRLTFSAGGLYNEQQT